MQDIINFINEDRETIIKNAVGWLKYNYPSRTSSYDKCSRDINFVLDAYVKDIKNRSICNIISVASKYWKDGERQIVDYEAELAVHQFIINFICETLNVNDDNRKFLAFLRNILMNIIIKGINTDSSIASDMGKYKYVIEYNEDPEENCRKIIEDALTHAWQVTPSKNNFMPYNVHLLTPKNNRLIKSMYYKCLENETKANGNRLTELEDLLKYEKEKYSGEDNFPNYINLKTAPYMLIFTQRVEDKPSKWQQDLINEGFVYEQTATSGKKKEDAKKVARLEIGMFTSNFSNFCLSKGIDISHTLCFPGEMEMYEDFDFLDTYPLLIMTAGKGKLYRRQHIEPGVDLKPNFDRIVKIVG